MTTPPRRARILVIDDEESIRRALKSILSLRNYEVSLASTGAEGIGAAIESNPELVVLDLTLPDMDGLDDYLTKPFSAGELLARIRALLRRAEARVIQSPEIRAGELVVNLAKRQVFLGGREVPLTKTEFEILALLAQNIDCVVTYRMLAERLWGNPEEKEPQLLRVHVSNLRKKIEPDPALPRYIRTEPGIGFRFSAE